MDGALHLTRANPFPPTKVTIAIKIKLPPEPARQEVKIPEMRDQAIYQKRSIFRRGASLQTSLVGLYYLISSDGDRKLLYLTVWPSSQWIEKGARLTIDISRT